METPDSLSPHDTLDVPKLLKQLTDDLSYTVDYVHRMETADEVMEAWWEGQHESGRKVSNPDTGEAPSPFDGASDQRIRLAEEIVNEKVLLQKAALINGTSSFTPVESADAPDAAIMQSLLGYFLQGSMRKEVRDQTDYLLNWAEGYGKSVLGICWHEERALEAKSLTEEDLIRMAGQMGLDAAGLPGQEEIQAAAQSGQLEPAVMQTAVQIMQQATQTVVDLILDPAREPMLYEALLAYDPAISKAEAKRIIPQLRKTREASYYAPYVKESRPKWEALCPMVDVFFPPGMEDIQRAPRVARVHWLSATDVQDRAQLHGWPADAVERVLANPGRVLDLGDLGQTSGWILSTASVRRGLDLPGVEDPNKDRFELLEVWHRQTSLAGAPAVYRTLIHGSYLDAPLEHELSPYKHGNYPFVTRQRERKKRSFMESRGIPELVMTNQWAIKQQHDARTDRTSLAVSPPLIVASNRSGGRIHIGPNMQISEKRVGTLRWFQPPPLDIDSVGIIKDERALVDAFFGRFSASVPQPVVQLHNQTLVDDWLCDVSQAVLMTTQLIQQYVSPERASRIVGQEYTLDATRTAIQAQWDLRIAYDVRDFNLEWLQKKAKMITEFVLAADSLGVVDRAGYVKYLFAAIDPVMARSLVRNQQEALKSELTDEQAALSVIFSGSEPEMNTGGDHAARLQFMQQDLAKSPTRQQLYQSNGQIRAVWDNRAKFHEFQLQQRENAIIGRTGGRPVLEG